ncbi:MAG: F0F1 ATP synthase subunit delta [Bacteriovoracaceae bacterium]|nr:F0F1 ATP synthase subunit delta [Bacteriovoracaceae bacterium]
MKQQTVSKIYAQALLQLGEEKKVKVVDELIALTEMINKTNSLENVLFLDVFTQEEKKAVFADIAKKAGLAEVVVGMVNYLIEEKRIGLMPLIVKEMIVLDDERKGFLKGTIEGAELESDPKLIEKMKAFLKERLGKEPSLTYIQNKNISAGYRVTVEDLQMDASLDYQLDQFKQSVISE